MQKVRWNRSHRCGSLQLASGWREKATQEASSAQRPGSQLKAVQ
jgi:hypothetical protein